MSSLLPPRLIRRVIWVPVAVLVCLVALLFSPLLLLLALFAVPSRRGRRRAVRLVWFGAAWLAMELAALFASLVLWIASGFGGRMHTDVSQDRHYALVRWFLASLMRQALRVFRLQVQIEEPDATEEELQSRLTRPVIVLSRHAGPGDSFLLVHHLLTRYGRKPRIVMKASLQFDPSLDVVINRLPHAFIYPHRRPVPAAAPEPAEAGVPEPAEAKVPEPAEGAIVAEIRRLASGLGTSGALVIFPEGRNFTPSRWRRGISQLEQSRRHDEAQRASHLHNLLPPRSGGVFAAIDSARDADVIFVAHTGLDTLITVGDVWRALPMEQVIKARWWRVPAQQVPRRRDEVVRWLYDWWEHIDGWIEENRPAQPTGPAQARPADS